MATGTLGIVLPLVIRSFGLQSYKNNYILSNCLIFFSVLEFVLVSLYINEIVVIMCPTCLGVSPQLMISISPLIQFLLHHNFHNSQKTQIT